MDEDVGAVSSAMPLFYRSSSTLKNAESILSEETERIIQKLKDGAGSTPFVAPKPPGVARLFDTFLEHDETSLSHLENECPLVMKIIKELNSIQAYSKNSTKKDIQTTEKTHEKQIFQD